jgi:Na+/melibiose symporter-like transporter
VLKDSYIERAAAKENEERKQKKEPVKAGKILQAVFANRAVLAVTFSMIFYKAFSFILSLSAMYVFRYYFMNFAAFGLYSTVFNLTCIGGVCVGVYWRKFFKDTKKAFIVAGCLQIIMFVIIAVSFKSLNAFTYTVLVGISEFFAGLYDAYFVPMFAAGADFGEYKTGKRADGLTMAIYTMSVTFGSTINTAIRTAVLSKAGYNAAAYAKGAAPTAEVKTALAGLVTYIPLVLCVLCIACIAFIYPLSDKKHGEIMAEIKARKLAS